MDPEANYQEMLKLATRLLDSENDDADRLAELVLAMDGWLKRGGFLPKAWAKGREAAIEELKRECHAPDVIIVEKDIPRCMAKSPVLKDDWGDDTVTECWLPSGHAGNHCGTDGANGWLRWQK